MKEALKQLSRSQIEFICKECGITEEELNALNEDDLYSKVYDPMCDIETDELPSDNSEVTEHCQTASDIVTILGNAIAEENGSMDDFEKELNDEE